MMTGRSRRFLLHCDTFPHPSTAILCGKIPVDDQNLLM